MGSQANMHRILPACVTIRGMAATPCPLPHTQPAAGGRPSVAVITTTSRPGGITDRWACCPDAMESFNLASAIFALVMVTIAARARPTKTTLRSPLGPSTFRPASRGILIYRRRAGHHLGRRPPAV